MFLQLGFERSAMKGNTSRKSVQRRPQQQRSKAKVEALLIAGTRILEKQGWAGFNTNAVAALAGVSIGTLYEYFPNKQALIDAIVVEHLSNIRKRLEIASYYDLKNHGVQELVHIMVDLVIELHKDKPKLHHTLSSEVPLSPAVLTIISDLRKQFVDLVSKALDGQVTNPFIAAQLLVDASDAAIHRWWINDQGQPLPAQELAEELKSMFTAYLRAKACAEQKSHKVNK